MIKIYDTMTRSLRDFVPLHEGQVNMYVCGPTVYNYIHIGNARSSVAFDTIRRYFEYAGYQVNYISVFPDGSVPSFPLGRTEKPVEGGSPFCRGEYVVQFFAGGHHLFDQYSGK